MTEPSLVRARHIRMMLGHLETFPEARQRAVHEALGAEELDRIRRAANTEWLPFEVDLRFVRAVFAALGDAGAKQFFHDYQLAELGGPMFLTLVQSASAIFGLDPVGWAKWIPRAWSQFFKKVGQWSIERTAPFEVDMALVSLPPVCLEEQLFIRGLEGSMSPIFDLTRTSGVFRLAGVDPARNAALFELRWTARG